MPWSWWGPVAVHSGLFRTAERLVLFLLKQWELLERSTRTRLPRQRVWFWEWQWLGRYGGRGKMFPLHLRISIVSMSLSQLLSGTGRRSRTLRTGRLCFHCAGCWSIETRIWQQDSAPWWGDVLLTSVLLGYSVKCAGLDGWRIDRGDRWACSIQRSAARYLAANSQNIHR